MTTLTDADLNRLDLLSARTDMISVLVAPDKLAALIALARRARRMEAIPGLTALLDGPARVVPVEALTDVRQACPKPQCRAYEVITEPPMIPPLILCGFHDCTRSVRAQAASPYASPTP